MSLKEKGAIYWLISSGFSNPELTTASYVPLTIDVQRSNIPCYSYSSFQHTIGSFSAFINQIIKTFVLYVEMTKK
jgi:hypothetical protein